MNRLCRLGQVLYDSGGRWNGFENFVDAAWTFSVSVARLEQI